jgi:CelD/BcsL family acetyltransferase involved in cellulose biosynthesis
VLATLIRWKSAQYRRTRVTDVFAFPWTVQLLERIAPLQDVAFAGKMWALYIGDRLAAIEVGIRSYGVLQGWFSAYDRSLAKWSPGLLLLLQVAKTISGMGITRFDLGKGVGDYKACFASGAIPLAEGSVALRPAGRLLRRGWHYTRRLVRKSRFLGPARLLARWTRPLRGWLAFR